MRRLILVAVTLVLSCHLFAQKDSADAEALSRMISLSEVVIRTDLDVPKFLRHVKFDTTFYKAFRNLRVLGFTSFNNIYMMDKKGKVKASLQSKTRQKRQGGCRTMEILEEKTSGDMYNSDHDWNYYTAELYASLFFTNGRVCGENNVVKGAERKVREKKGLEKHKEQLKMMFFNPGKKIPGIPFIGDKLDVFDKKASRLYNFSLDLQEYKGQLCYVFSIKAKPGLSGGQKDKIVFDNITTWFHPKTLEIIARNYDLSYSAGVYDFDVNMEVQMTHFGHLLVPQVITYKGDWDVAFKKREKGVFTATLSDFKN